MGPEHQLVQTRTPLAFIHHNQSLMSHVTAFDHSSGDESSFKRMRTDHLSPRNSPTQDVAVSLDVLKAEARERLEAESEPEPNKDIESIEDEENCIICLQPVVDRTVLINCAHDRMCFVCIKQWTGEFSVSSESRRKLICTSLYLHFY